MGLFTPLTERGVDWVIVGAIVTSLAIAVLSWIAVGSAAWWAWHHVVFN